MNQITPHSLWIGSSGATRDLRRLYDLGIRAVVQLAYEEPPLSLPHDLIAYRIPLLDGGDNEPELLRLAIDTVTLLLAGKFGTLVCCHAGLSRSPVIAAAALARLTNQSIGACLTQLAAQHPCDVLPALLLQVEQIQRSHI